MVNLFSVAKISLRSLATNKMRSALTMLGVIIGVMAVITMLAVGSGASQKITQQIESIGSNLLMVVPGATTAGGVRMGPGTQVTLTGADAYAIKAECSAVLDVAPEFGRVAQVVYKNMNWSTAIRGTTPGYLVVREWKLSAGRMFTTKDVRNATKVAVLGQTVVQSLFGTQNPIGEVIRINKVPFAVIGVLESKGESPIGMDQDDTILIPLGTAQKRLFKSEFPDMANRIIIKVKESSAIALAMEQTTKLLRQRHRINAGEENDFTIRNLAQYMQTAQASSRIMTLLLGSIASVSLLVGGIGIMNIMLVSVTERTREIGIRMAIGAKTWDIRLQFLIEALILSLLGGVVGILIGVGASYAISALLEWPTVISSASILLAFGFSALVGLFFGYYPAHKASKLSPIEALRRE